MSSNFVAVLPTSRVAKHPYEIIWFTKDQGSALVTVKQDLQLVEASWSKRGHEPWVSGCQSSEA